MLLKLYMETNPGGNYIMGSFILFYYSPNIIRVMRSRVKAAGRRTQTLDMPIRPLGKITYIMDVRVFSPIT
jgi:hypothetical protein